MSFQLGENVVLFIIMNIVTLSVYYLLRRQYSKDNYQVFICSIFVSTFFSVFLMDILQKVIRSGSIKLSQGFGGRFYHPPLYMDRPLVNNMSYGVCPKKRV